MVRRKMTRTDKERLKNAKQMHKKEQRLDPTWFNAKLVDLASEIITAVTQRPPRWGAFTFKMKEVGHPTTLIKFK